MPGWNSAILVAWRFQFQDAGLDATGPGFAAGVHAAYSARAAPEHREQIARRLGRGAGCADPCG
jgi:hypothetical protein